MQLAKHEIAKELQGKTARIVRFGPNKNEPSYITLDVDGYRYELGASVGRLINYSVRKLPSAS